MASTIKPGQQQLHQAEGELVPALDVQAQDMTPAALAAQFHAHHPQVLDGLIRICRPYAHLGRLSVKWAYESLKLEYRLLGNPLAHKLANNHAAYYAVLIMGAKPEWDGLFRTNTNR